MIFLLKLFSLTFKEKTFISFARFETQAEFLTPILDVKNQ